GWKVNIAADGLVEIDVVVGRSVLEHRARRGRVTRAGVPRATHPVERAEGKSVTSVEIEPGEGHEPLGQGRHRAVAGPADRLHAVALRMQVTAGPSVV